MFFMTFILPFDLQRLGRFETFIDHWNCL